MKKAAILKFFSFILMLSLIFSVVSVVSFADDDKIYVSVGDSALYRGNAPDAESFEPVYYKNGVGIGGSEADYNAKLEYSAESGFTLTVSGLDISNAEGEYSIFADCDINIVILSDSKIVHTVHENTKNRYAIYVSGSLTVSGDGEIDVYLRGDCDFGSLDSHAIRAHEKSGADKINVLDGRSSEEKKIDEISSDFENKLNKTNYELSLWKLNFSNKAEELAYEAERAKTVAIVAVVIGSVSLLANAAITVALIMNRKKSDADVDDED